MSEILVSIVVPHKNSFHLLLRLLASIPNDEAIEVLVVDDCSNVKDKNAIKEEHFNKNVRVFFSDDSKGAGHARNVGISKANGKWLLFADADDFFVPKMYYLISPYFYSEAEIVFFGTRSIYNQTGAPAYRHVRYQGLVEDYISYGREFEGALRFCFTPPWGKLIRRDIVESGVIRFEEIPASNDMMFSIQVGCLAKRIAVCKLPLYVITVTEGSITNSISKENFLSAFFAALRVNSFLRTIKNKSYQQSVLYFIYKSWHFGFGMFFLVLYHIIINRSNIFIGLEKILTFRKTIKERETR